MGNLVYSGNGSYTYYYGMIGSSGLSWENLAEKYVYLYDDPKPIWFESGAGASGNIVTGAPLYVRMEIGAAHSMMLPSTGLKLTWSAFEGVDTQWRIYLDTNLTPYLPVTTNQPLYFVTGADSAFMQQYDTNYFTLEMTGVQLTITDD